MTRGTAVVGSTRLRPVTNLASGWYVAVPSMELRRSPCRVTLFGEEFVGWRDQDGHAHLHSAVCPHMGAALYHGKVVDGAISCPFHRWRFDPAGRCVSVPDGRPPARAALRRLTTRECSGYVWTWYGRGAPNHEPPTLASSERRRRPGLRRFRLADATRATTRRILENTYDPDHLVALHGLSVAGETRITFPPDAPGDRDNCPPPERFDAVLTWPSYRGVLGAVSNAVGLNAEVFTLRVRGWASCQQIEYFADDRRLYQMVLAVTPVGEHHSIQHINVVVDADGSRALRWLRALVHRAEVQVAARQDLPIFDSLLPGDRHGIYVAGDEAVRHFRRFYRRWVDAADG